MQEIWSSNSGEIRRELKKLAVVLPPLSLHDSQGHVGASRLRALVHRDRRILLVLQRPARLTEVGRVSKVVYKMPDRPFIYFPVKVEIANERFLLCAMPNRLYYLQRRRFPRYRIKNRGAAAFFLQARGRVCRMEIDDLSLGGARLTGTPRYDLHSFEAIGPATLSIVSEDDLVLREINISRATVVRSVVGHGARWDVGLRFHLENSERHALADVLVDSFAKMIFQ